MFVEELRTWIDWVVRESTSPSAQFSIRAILSRVYVQLDARPIEEELWEDRFLREGRMFVPSWKSSELESTESYEKAPRPQPNSVFAHFSVVCMFNWMLGQLRKVVGRSYVRGRAPNL